MPNAARPRFSLAWERVPTLVRVRVGPVLSRPSDSTGSGLRPRAIASVSAHESGSKSHTRSAGWRSMALARGDRAARGLRPRGERAQPKYRDKSTIAPVLFKLLF